MTEKQPEWRDADLSELRLTPEQADKFAGFVKEATEKLIAAMGPAAQATAKAGQTMMDLVQQEAAKLTLAELADIRELAVRNTFSSLELQAAVLGARTGTLPADPKLVDATAEVVKRARWREQAEKWWSEGKPLEEWHADALLAQLPIYAKESKDLEKLSTRQLMAAIEYGRRNCTTPDPITYDGALVGRQLPELLRRLVAARLVQDEGNKLSRLRVAWELYRSGAAQLEEVAPILDEVMALEEPTKPEPPKVEIMPAEGTRPFTTVTGLGVPVVGQLISVSSVPYRVVDVRRERTIHVRLLDDRAARAGGAEPFWVEWR